MSANCATWICTGKFDDRHPHNGHMRQMRLLCHAPLSPYILMNATSYQVIGGVMFAISLSTATCMEHTRNKGNEHVWWRIIHKT
jgi:hypothetical protein